MFGASAFFFVKKEKKEEKIKLENRHLIVINLRKWLNENQRTIKASLMDERWEAWEWRDAVGGLHKQKYDDDTQSVYGLFLNEVLDWGF